MSNVCRLCLTKDHLVWIFDKRFQSSEDMKDVIYITTGVQINVKDVVSQKICKKCCEVTIKMFEFRRTSLANDKFLREQSLIQLENSIKIPHTEVTIRNDPKSGTKAENVKKDQGQESVFKVHPTVRDLFKVYPQIKLPTVCLKSHIKPFVSLPMDQVENYFKIRKLDIHEHTKLALRSGRIATKKTASPVIPKPYSYSLSNNLKITPTGFHENANKEKVPPIKIVQSKYQSDSRVVNKVDNTSLKTYSGKSPENIVPESLPQERKRKIDELETTPKKESFKKPAFIESLGLTPKVSVYSSVTTPESPAYVANKSIPLHICDICNSVQYSVKDLKKHQHKHLRCQFCKMRFRTLDSKYQHIQNTCVIKQTMNNLPNVVLNKIENDVKVRRKYPESFVGFPPLKDIIGLDDEGVSMNLSKGTDQIRSHPLYDTSKVEQLFCNTDQQSSVVDPVVIEILSDDEEPLSPVRGTNKENVISNHVLKNNVITNNESNDIKDKADIVEGSTANVIVPATTVTEETAYNTVSIVKPNIRVNGNCILDRLDPKLSDTKLLKELLSNKPLQISDEKNVQTDLPADESIYINRMDSTIELKELKQQLDVYKIPVIIKFGPLNVSYNYQAELKQPRKLCLWNDLMPIDIKTNKPVLNSTSQVVAEVDVYKDNAVQSTSSTTTTVTAVSSVNTTEQKCLTTTASQVVAEVNVNKNSVVQNTSSTTTTVTAISSVNTTQQKCLTTTASQVVTEVNVNKNNAVQSTSSTTTTVTPVSSVNATQQKCLITTASSSLSTICNLPSSNLTSPKFIRINKSCLVNPPNIMELNPLLNKFLHATSTSTTTSTVITTVSSIPTPVLVTVTSTSTSASTTVSSISIPASTRVSSTSIPASTTGSSTPTPASTTVNTPVSNSNTTVGTIRVKNVWELT